MENQEKKIEDLRTQFTHIPGWAIDADPKNEPTYPMKNYTGDDHKRLDWERPPQQEKTTEILQSTEHERTPAVFGTNEPPSGLSGVIRKQAFTYSESMLRHWLLLILADRVNTAEGLVSDLTKAKLPNIWKEKGLGALWEHDKKKFGKQALLTVTMYAAVAGFVTWMILREKEERPARKMREHVL